MCYTIDMFTATNTKALQRTHRFGKVDAPAVSEETLEKYHDLYTRATEGADDPHTLVLGATPELRDIVLSQGHALTTVDRDADALKEKTAQMHYQLDPNETVVISDWLTMALPGNSIDVIIGDGVLTALDQAAQKQLLEKLHNILKPTGTLILREGSVLHSRPRYAPSVHIHEYRTGQYNIFDLFFGLRLYNQGFKSIDTQTRKTYLKEFQSKIEDYYEEGLLSIRERDELDSIAEELEQTLLYKGDLEDMLRVYFFPKEVIHDIGSGHLSPWYFFLLQPNDPIDLPDHVPAERYNYVKEFLASQTDSTQY